MKTKIIIYIIFSFLLILNSCENEKKPYYFTFQFDKPATLIIKHNLDYSLVGITLPFLSPDFKPNYKHIAATKNLIGESVVKYNISCPSEVFLSINRNLRLPLFLVPGDTLYMNLEFIDSSNIHRGISFSGDLSPMNDFKVMRNEVLGDFFQNKCAKILRANLPLNDMQKSIDSLSQIELDFINQYDEIDLLPEWYIDYEISQVEYAAASNKCRILNSRKLEEPKDTVPISSYSFLDDIQINNYSALISPYYYYFLKQYFSRYLPDSVYKMSIDDRKKILGSFYLDASKNHLSGEVANIYQTYIISLIIDRGRYQIAEEKIQNLKSEMTNAKYISYLENYLLDKLSLHEGVEAPEFYLLNLSNEYKSLSDYKGNVILLNFWFPGCKPCIKEIPFEKKLISDLKDEKFNLINICFYSTEQNWRNSVKQFELEGINLLANENWQNKLRESYKITSHPFYSLIDKEGKIFANNSKRPSGDVLEDILRLLAE